MGVCKIITGGVRLKKNSFETTLSTYLEGACLMKATFELLFKAGNSTEKIQYHLNGEGKDKIKKAARRVPLGSSSGG